MLSDGKVWGEFNTYPNSPLFCQMLVFLENTNRKQLDVFNIFMKNNTMKKILLLLLFIPLVSFGQDVNLNVDKKVEFTEKKDVKRGMGLNYQGSGLYTLGKWGSSIPWEEPKKIAKMHIRLENEIVEEIIEFTTRNNYNYEITLVEKLGTRIPYVIVTFKVFNKDGSLVLNKEDAKKQLIELKEYLDLGIITQEEFDTKAVSLKKILLGN